MFISYYHILLREYLRLREVECVCVCVCVCLLGQHLQHMEVPRLGVELEL